IALETQRSRWQDWFLHIDNVTISPKPPRSKMRVYFHILDEIIDKLLNNKQLRQTNLDSFIFNDKDLQFGKEVKQRTPLSPLYLQVGNEDLDQSDNDQLTRQLLNAYEWLIRQTMAEKALNHARVLPQMHALVWGNRRGV